MTEKKEKKKGKLLLLAVMLALLCAWMPQKYTQAANSAITIETINYDEETITLKSSVDTKLYYSDAKQTKWECAHGTFKNGTYVFDISWIKKTKDYTLSLKGDKSLNPITVILPKQQTNFKITYDYAKTEFQFQNIEGSQQVEWRKSSSTSWHTLNRDAASLSEMVSILNRFYAKGTTLCFRLKQIQGGASGTNGQVSSGLRPSKEVKLKVTKQAAAPSVSITVSSKTLGLSGTPEYRKGGSGDWSSASSKKIEIKEIAAEAFRADGKDGQDVLISFRTAATEKKPQSLEKDITIKAQEAEPGDNVEIKFASCTSISITIPEVKQTTEDGKEVVVQEAASASNPYEYTVVEKDSTLSDTAKWTTIKSASAVKITDTKAPTGSKVYVRKQAHVIDKTIYYPESEAKVFTVGEYPEESHVDIVEISDWVNKTVKDDDSIEINLFKTAKMPIGENLKFKVVVADILYPDADVKSISCGGKELEFKSEKGENELVVTITSVEKFENAVSTRDKAASVTITLTNGEVLKNLVQLTIFRDSSILKETALEVVNAPNNTAKYQFTVVPAKLVGKENGENKTASIKSITIPELKKTEGEAAPTVGFSAAKDADGNLEVTLNNASLQTFFTNGIQEDKKYALTITMDNGESFEQELASGVSITFTEEAVIDGAPYSFTKKAGSDLDQNIQLQLNYKTPGLRVTSITWNGTDICGNSSSNSKYIIVDLDKQKINALTLLGGSEESYDIVITFSNGATITEGCTLTLQP